MGERRSARTAMDDRKEDTQALPHEEFAHFVAACAPRLLRTCRALTGSHADADDLLQTALARCYARWSRIRSMHNVEAYVRRVIYTQYISSQRRPRFPVLGSADRAQEPTSGADVGEQATAGLVVLSAVARLPVRQRAVVVLTYLDDQPDEQIAELLSCAVGTVKSHRAKALAALRVALGERGDLLVGGSR